MQKHFKNASEQKNEDSLLAYCIGLHGRITYHNSKNLLVCVCIIKSVLVTIPMTNSLAKCISQGSLSQSIYRMHLSMYRKEIY